MAGLLRMSLIKCEVPDADDDGEDELIPGEVDEVVTDMGCFNPTEVGEFLKFDIDCRETAEALRSAIE